MMTPLAFDPLATTGAPLAATIVVVDAPALAVLALTVCAAAAVLVGAALRERRACPRAATLERSAPAITAPTVAADPPPTASRAA